MNPGPLGWFGQGLRTWRTFERGPTLNQEDGNTHKNKDLGCR